MIFTSEGTPYNGQYREEKKRFSSLLGIKGLQSNQVKRTPLDSINESII